MKCEKLEQVRENKVKAKAEEYGANPDMVEVLYREMISCFVSMEMKEFNERNR